MSRFGLRQRTGAVGEGGIQITPSEECFNRDGLGSPWLLDHCDEEAGREEQSSLTFDLNDAYPQYSA